MWGFVVITISFLLTAGAGITLVILLERAVARSRPAATSLPLEERRKQNVALHRNIGKTLEEERTLRAELRDVERRQQEGLQ